MVVRPRAQPPAQARRLEAVLRTGAGVMLVIGERDGAQVRLQVARQPPAGRSAKVPSRTRPVTWSKH